MKRARSLWFPVLAATLFGGPMSSRAAESPRPNIVWILAEDIGPDLSCYGTPAVHTPVLDKLAADGGRYEFAFTTAPVCSTSRSAMMTGMYQNAIGASQHRTEVKRPLPDGIIPFPLLLQTAGYHVGMMISNKTDLNFACDPARLFPDGDWATAGDRPFFVQITIANTHRPWRRHLDHDVDPAKVVVPPYYPDTPLVRRDIANGLGELEIADAAVGKILKRLDDEGLADNTLVIFIGDNGRCEVRGKQFLYEQGTRVPLLMRWPRHIRPGTVCDDLTSAIDVTATILAAAGVGVPEWMQGRNMLDPEASKRRYIFTARDKMDDTHDAIRACRDRRFKYILNLMPDRAYCQLNEYKERQYPILALLNVMHLKGQLDEIQDRFMQPHKPHEEFYDLIDDPYETKNRVDDPALRDDLERMRRALAEWQAEVRDQGVSAEFRNGGWPATYPTATLETWEQRLAAWNEKVFLPAGPPKPSAKAAKTRR